MSSSADYYNYHHQNTGSAANEQELLERYETFSHRRSGDSELKRPIMPRATIEGHEVVAQDAVHLSDEAAPFYMRLEALPLSVWHYYAVITLSGGLLIDGYETGMMSATQAELARIFNTLGSSAISLLGSWYFIGGAIGSLLFGYYAQTHGRKNVFYITLGIYIISVVLSMFSYNISFLCLTRLFSGIAIGGEYTAIYAMVDEVVPAQYRGRITFAVSAMWHFGAMISGTVGWMFQSRMNNEEDRNTWRVLLFIGALLAIPLLYLRKYLPESPRWILGMNKQSEAEVVVDLITYCCEHDCIIPLEEQQDSGEGEQAGLTQLTIQQDPPAETSNYRTSPPELSGTHPFIQGGNMDIISQFMDNQLFLLSFFSYVLDSFVVLLQQEINGAGETQSNFIDVMRTIVNRYQKRFALCFALTFASNFVYKGQLAWNKFIEFTCFICLWEGSLFYTHSMMMRKLDVTREYEDSYFVLPLVLASFLGVVVSARFFDTLGRRRMNSIVCLASGFLLFVNAVLFAYSIITPKIQLFLWLAIVFCTSPALSAAHLSVSELFPLPLRSQALALFNTIAICVAGAIAPYFFGVLANHDSMDSFALGYFTACCLMITASAVSYSLGIHAENIPLEEIPLAN